MEILAIGDLHLGRRSAHASAVVEHLDDGGAISPRAAWDRCVDYAVECGVRAVVLTGDLVEQPRDFYEAYLREHGYLPAQAPLSADAIHQRVLSARHDYLPLEQAGDAAQRLARLLAAGVEAAPRPREPADRLPADPQ